ncbi:hypothetical protein [Melittangium boletus]|uniref:hypothetical protein n=1 Tax=Melittangium boletus TaxID=83453 RepID=UPI003DA1D96E
MTVSELIAEGALRLALVACLLECGGSLYEYAVVDTVWPSNLAVIQPQRGGLDRKRFWVPLHGVLTLALPVALWACWGRPDVRAWLLAATGLYVVLRGWTFAYFIPRVIRFEQGTDTDPARARRWVRWSLLRAPLLLALTLCVWRASLGLAGTSP